MATKLSKRSRLARNKRSFQKMKVDYYKYVKDFYLEDGLAYISCNVSNYNDIISSYSVEGYEWLNESFAQFVEGNAFYIPVEYPIVLQICGTKFNQQQRDVIRETIADYYELKLGDKQMDLRDNTSRIVMFLIIGVLFTSAMILLDKYHPETIILELIVIFVWFFIWELSDLLIYDRTDLIEEKMSAAQLARMKVDFKVIFEDEPVDDKEKQEIYQMIEGTSDEESK